MAPPPELKTGGWYTIDGRRYLSVTAALDYVNAPALMIWSANLAAEYAVANLPVMVAAMRVRPCGKTKREERCGRCLPCLQVKAARQHWKKSEDAKRRGSAVHDVIEFWAQRGEWPAYDEAYEPYIQSLRTFLDEYGLTHEAWTMTEATVFHEEDDWAGTLDGVVDVTPSTRSSAEFCARLGRVDQVATVLIDTKSREGAGARFYDTQPLQLAGYRHAQWVWVGGRKVEMPAVHGSAVLQLRPDGFTLRPVRSGAAEYETFCSVLSLARWVLSEGGGDKATQVQAFPVPDEWMWRPVGEAVSDEFKPGARARKVSAGDRPAGGRRVAGARKAATRGRAADSVDPRPAGSATLASIRAGMPALSKHEPRPVHPDSPYGDDIPF